MLSKTEMELMQRYLERDVQPRIPEIYKCGIGIFIVTAVSLFGSMVGVDSAGHAIDLTALLDPRVLEHLAGVGPAQ